MRGTFSPGGSSTRTTQETLMQGSPILLSSDLAAGLGEIPFDANEALRSGVLLRDRRCPQTQFQPSAIGAGSRPRLDPQACLASSLLLGQDARLRSADAKDLAMYLIQSLQAAGLSVIWYLAPLTNPGARPFGARDHQHYRHFQVADPSDPEPDGDSPVDVGRAARRGMRTGGGLGGRLPPAPDGAPGAAAQDNFRDGRAGPRRWPRRAGPDVPGGGGGGEAEPGGPSFRRQGPGGRARSGDPGPSLPSCSSSRSTSRARFTWDRHRGGGGGWSGQAPRTRTRRCRRFTALLWQQGTPPGQ